MQMRLFRSDIIENLWLAMATLRANKLRSFLTVTGVIIGVITVMLIASLISGIDSSVRKEVESYRSEEHTSELQSLTNLDLLSLHDALPISSVAGKCK